jgi:hypothetical protein
LVLDGLHPTLARVQTRLASVRAAVRVSATAGGGTAPLDGPVEMACDTFAIDGDRQTFSLTWRGRVDVAERVSVVILAALEAPASATDWARIRQESPAEAVVPAPTNPANLHSTAMPAGGPQAAPLPFHKDVSSAAVMARMPTSTPPPRAKPSGTVALSLADLPSLDPPALPFAQPEGPVSRSSPPVSPASEAPPPATAAPLPKEEPEALPAMAPPRVPTDPWARPIPAPEAPSTPLPPPPPAAFARPAASALKDGLYARFKR